MKEERLPPTDILKLIAVVVIVIWFISNMFFPDKSWCEVGRKIKVTTSDGVGIYTMNGWVEISYPYDNQVIHERTETGEFCMSEGGGAYGGYDEIKKIYLKFKPPNQNFLVVDNTKYRVSYTASFKGRIEFLNE